RPVRLERHGAAHGDARRLLRLPGLPRARRARELRLHELDDLADVVRLRDEGAEAAIGARELPLAEVVRAREDHARARVIAAKLAGELEAVAAVLVKKHQV